VAGRRVKTLAVSEETYAAVAEFKRKHGYRTMDEALRALLSLSRLALALEAVEYVKGKKLSPEELRLLREERERIRGEASWLRRR